MIGKQILHYTITEELGRGGMGVVYKAEDTKLERTVALKFLPPEFTLDAEAKDRFFHEARAASSLDHPNICTIYEINEVDGHTFIAMGYVEGRTLKERMREGPFEIGEAVDIARQIAEGLSEAHEKGIVHRDIKPGNIMITARGQVKIMDFGLAKSAGRAKLTKTGTTVGTVHYMSPEQARGVEVDRRTDIWSLGVILYEMLAGKPPFRGDYEQAVIFSIINDEVEPIGAIRTDVPTGLERLIGRALDKNRDSRYQRAGDLLEDIGKISGPVDAMTVEPHMKQRRKNTAVYATLGLSLIVILVLLYMVVFRKDEQRASPVSTQVTFNGSVYSCALSPDGNYIAYATGGYDETSKLWIKDLGSGSEVEIGSDVLFFGIRWSPDGSKLKFSAFHDTEKGGVYIVPRFGGAPQKILNIPWYYATWSPDGSRIAYYGVNEKKIKLLDLASGRTDTLSLEHERGVPFGLDWSPRHDYLLLQIDQEGRQSIRAAKTDGTKIHTLLERRYADVGTINGINWSHDGEAIYYMRGEMRGRYVYDLMKLLLDIESGKATGSPLRVLGGLQMNMDGSMGTPITISSDGSRLAYVQEVRHSNMFLYKVKGEGEGQLVEERQLTFGTSWKSAPSISPDGKRVAFAVGEGDESNIYTLSLEEEGGAPRKLTFLDSWNDYPVWSPDGTEICFYSHGGGVIKLWRVNAGGGSPEPFEGAISSTWYDNPEWAPGPEIICRTTSYNNFAIFNPRTGEQRPMIDDPPDGYIFDPCWSPDGKYIAFFWNRTSESGQMMRTWILSVDDGSLRMLSDQVAGPITWSDDGKWIYVVSLDKAHDERARSIYRVPFSGGDLEHYVQLSLLSSTGRERIDMTPDGSTIVLKKIESQQDAWLVENFDADNN